MNINKLRTPQGFFTHTGVGRIGKVKVEILVDDIERMVAEGMTRKDLAKHYKISYKYINRRINESDSLSQAYKRGKQKWSISRKSTNEL